MSPVGTDPEGRTKAHTAKPEVEKNWEFTQRTDYSENKGTAKLFSKSIPVQNVNEKFWLEPSGSIKLPKCKSPQIYINI